MYWESIHFSITTMEDVFLKIGEISAKEEDKASKGKGKGLYLITSDLGFQMVNHGIRHFSYRHCLIVKAAVRQKYRP